MITGVKLWLLPQPAVVTHSHRAPIPMTTTTVVGRLRGGTCGVRHVHRGVAAPVGHPGGEFPKIADARWVGLTEARVKLVRGQLPVFDALEELLRG